MADGRFLSKTIAHSAQLAALPDQAEILFYRMLPHLDCEGRLVGDPKLVKAIAVPLKDDYTVEAVTDLLYLLAETKDEEGMPLIQWYEIKGRKVIQFPNFATHQRGLRKEKEAPSRLPSYGDGATLVARRKAPRTKDGTGTDQGRSKDGAGTEKVGVREEKGSLREGEGKVPPGGGSAVVSLSWSVRACELWEKYRGEPNGGRIGKHLKPLVYKHGPRQVLTVWEGYLEDRVGKDFCKVEDFRDNYQHFRRRWGVMIGEDGSEIPIPDEPVAVPA